MVSDYPNFKGFCPRGSVLRDSVLGDFVMSYYFRLELSFLSPYVDTLPSYISISPMLTTLYCRISAQISFYDSTDLSPASVTWPQWLYMMNWEILEHIETIKKYSCACKICADIKKVSKLQHWASKNRFVNLWFKSKSDLMDLINILRL